jgi:cyclase
MPTVAFSEATAVFLGGREVRALHFGRGHTDGDAVIHFPAERIIHTGDLFLARRPGTTGLSLYFDYEAGGSANEWVTVMDRILALDFDRVIPGHGAVSTRDDVVGWRDDLVEMRDRIRGMLREGATRDEVATVLVERYGWPPRGLAMQQLDALIEELRQ